MTDNLAASQDYYTQSAEWYDILSEQHWKARHASVSAALRAACPDARVVLDIGTGTGMALKLIADALPLADIHAIEPSASMRIGLMARILADAQLRSRVTVHPADIAQARLPAGIDVALACGCIGFFDPPTRRALWPRLAAALAPAGVVLVDVMPLDRPQSIPESQVADVQVGRHRYQIWLSGQPAGADPELIRWRTRFGQSDGATQLRSFAIEREWRAFGLDTVVDEAAAAGFTAERLTDSPVPAVLLRLA
ncbi:class I SAM-dependent methyltransferase [Xanthomonas hortorum]|uniref:class I SAM-dependent methyltransferase n=1 Tax=Xanthomonas hortorum TaxID=56454 RepID=UPI0015943DD1|nr:class I SAM-dependent methyltransferase [Xanthomonas hortorum]NHF68384.1 class I SAM-dependent methyltransferase [Xanthomonas hortorum]